MGKRPRTPHFITGTGDGNVHDRNGGKPNAGAATDDVFQLRGNRNSDNNNNPNGGEKNNYNYYYNLRAAKNERLQRLEDPLLASGDAAADHWRDVFGNQHQTDAGFFDIFGVIVGQFFQLVFHPGNQVLTQTEGKPLADRRRAYDTQVRGVIADGHLL